MTNNLPHAAGCPAQGGPEPIESCLLCLHLRELETLTREEVIAAVDEIQKRFGRGNVEHGYSDDATVEQLLDYLHGFQKTMGVGPLRRNATKCLGCKKIIESKNRHDYVTCPCGNVSADGGTWYGRTSWKEDGPGYELLMTTWPGEHLRELRSILSFNEKYQDGDSERLASSLKRSVPIP